MRSIEGNIECLISAKWGKGNHPGDLTPISWNKAQFYVRIYKENANDSSTILFNLDSIETIKLSKSDLKVKLRLKANSNSGPFGQDLGVLKKYTHIQVNIPFVHKRDTLDGKIILEKVNATFIINGEKKLQINHHDYFKIPFLYENKLTGFILDVQNLFHNIL